MALGHEIYAGIQKDKDPAYQTRRGRYGGLISPGCNVQALLDQSSGPLGYTALHYAVAARKFDLTQILLEAGADCHKQSNPSLSRARERGSGLSQGWRLQSGLAEQPLGETPFSLAVSKHDSVLITLIRQNEMLSRVHDYYALPVCLFIPLVYSSIYLFIILYIHIYIFFFSFNHPAKPPADISLCQSRR
jgi:hypothetical protein